MERVAAVSAKSQTEIRPLPEQGAYGERFGNAFGLKRTPTLVATRMHHARIAVTRLQCAEPIDLTTGSFEPEPAFSIGFALQDLLVHRLWLGRRLVHSDGYRQGSVSIVDLESRPSAHISCSFDCLQIYVPRDALDQMSAENGARRIETLTWPRGARDPILVDLARLLEPALMQPGTVETFFIDHVMLALQAHIAHTYGGMRQSPAVVRGGLASWQERRVKEFIEARLDGSVSIADLAAECDLSRSHFARAFKQTCGVTPYQWLMRRRIENAKVRMIETNAPLSDIALACGFSDQSHFTRAFSSIVRMSPANWRRRRIA
ncbi:AraC family transcriptional regulator [Aliidongia dinghuensis]|uniref:AraC family transcriptional regulator n=1 Tax=Aliidongia dinghuensis TaxID=1867774 RepID=A0A8J2YTI0_9PROT|nr:AraC family transcriptional regulator [Aliidongia dinghuensis]